MMFLIDAVLGRVRVDVAATERVLVLNRGRVTDILGPGEHRVARRGLVLERHDLAAQPQFVSTFGRVLMAERPDLVDRHLIVVQAAAGEAVAVFRDGLLSTLAVGPAQPMLLFREAAAFEVRRFDLTASQAVPRELVAHVLAGTFLRQVTIQEVPQGHVGLLSIDKRFVEVLEEGMHLFFRAGRTVDVRLLDLRRRTHDVTGQEVLTADRVTIRVNIAAEFRVVDPVKAATAVRDFDEALHRALQLAFRRTVGQRTLDRLLAEKVTVDAEAADKVRAEMAGIGLEVGEIALKDVILPGEMREILNRVVAAEKEAEANVIRRREETQATRSLLNTAKVMAENPVMLRLKELETLTELASKVERLTVHNGTTGLLNDLVRLRD